MLFLVSSRDCITFFFIISAFVCIYPKEFQKICFKKSSGTRHHTVYFIKTSF